MADGPGGEQSVQPNDKKQAVILIHGMGNQSPMATLRGFIDAVWTTDEDLHNGKSDTWTKPDARLDSRELRRITTQQDKCDIRTDFFEFYWAHMMHSTRLSSVLWWLKHLFVRPFRRVPEELRETWFAGWNAIIILLAMVVGFAWSILALVNPWQFSLGSAWLPLGISVGIGLFLWFLRRMVFVEVVGDAARYLTAVPENIAARAAIRETGLSLLKALHKSKDYDRIIVVGHSLGAVIGYDMLSFYWSDIAKTLEHEGSDAVSLRAIEDAATGVRHADGVPELSVEDYHLAQRKYADTLAVVSKRRWLVTDFVTLGSPLTHAHYLMVDDREDPLDSELKRAKKGWIGRYLGLDKPEHEQTAFDRVATLLAVRSNQREFPMCPPQTETTTQRCSRDTPDTEAFSYSLKGQGLCVPHHAALFAAVRWTNIYAPLQGALHGDQIGGPAAKLFGPGIKDVPLAGSVSKRLFAHNTYWQQPADDDEHIRELRRAVNLLDGCEPTAPQSSAKTE